MKHTITHEGKTFEVDIPGAISEADVNTRYMPKDVFEAELARRGTSIAEKAGFVNPKSLDAAGKKALLEALGVKSEGGSGDELGKQLERAKATWAETELKPVIEREGSLKAELEGARKERLYDAIVTAAAKAGVLQSLLEASGGSKAAIVAMHEHRYAFDEKTKGWYAKGANTDQPFAFATQPTAERPYKTVSEDIADWTRLPTSKPFMGASTQQGPGFNAGGKVSVGQGTIDGNDPLAFGRNLEAIASGKIAVQ